MDVARVETVPWRANFAIGDGFSVFDDERRQRAFLSLPPEKDLVVRSIAKLSKATENVVTTSHERAEALKAALNFQVKTFAGSGSGSANFLMEKESTGSSVQVVVSRVFECDEVKLEHEHLDKLELTEEASESWPMARMRFESPMETGSFWGGGQLRSFTAF